MATRPWPCTQRAPFLVPNSRGTSGDTTTLILGDRLINELDGHPIPRLVQELADQR